MSPEALVPVVCPLCGGILQFASTGLSCSLEHRYLPQQLDAFLSKQLQQTLTHLVRQLQENQCLFDMIAPNDRRTLPTASAITVASAQQLTEQLLALLAANAG